jgi:MoxR-like ATPase
VISRTLLRLFATMNTLGQGNLNGLYHGTQQLNHAQLDRWNLVTSLNYLPPAEKRPSCWRVCRSWPRPTGAARWTPWWRWPG